MGLLDSYFDPETMAAVKQLNRPSEDDMRNARNNALMQAGFSMMLNNGGRTKSEALMNALGSGGMAGMGAYNDQIEAARKRNIEPLNTAIALKRLNRENLPAGMQMGPDGKPVWIPGYLEGQMQLRQQQQQPYFQFLPTANGYAIGDARKGTISMPDSPIMRASDDPALQGKISGAKEQAKVEVEAGSDAKKAVKRSDTLLEYANEAGTILNQNPTHSGLGAAVDAAGRLVGVSTKGSQDAARLEAISGWMVSNVPRMEGPQSNFDVKNYETMAGKVGDRTVPIEERKAALKTLIDLQNKYRHLNGGDNPDSVRYPSDAGKPGVKVPAGNEQRNSILSKELQKESENLAAARKNGDLKGISEANRNIQLLQKELGAKASQEAPKEAPKVRRYNPQTGRIE